MTIFFLNVFIWLTILLCGLSGFGVFLKRNPVHSVLCLISAFFSGGILILINNSEFLSMILITVYVGAVAVLFLFVVMMIDIDHLKKNINKKSELFVGFLVAGGFFFILFNSFAKELKSQDYKKLQKAVDLSVESLSPNSLAGEKILKFTNIIYNSEHCISLIVVSLILLVAIIGVISLSLREKTGLKKQDSILQNMRKKEDTLEIKKVVSGEGVSDE
jgi:NADH-quinone oxidoreductase subunit J